MNENIQLNVDSIDNYDICYNLESSGKRETKLSRNTKTEYSLVLPTEKKQTVCEECNKQYSSPQALHFHIKAVHEKLTIECDKCGKQFTCKTNLWQHNKSVHEGVQYPCEYCNYKATTKQSLNTHKLGHHKST